MRDGGKGDRLKGVPGAVLFRISVPVGRMKTKESFLKVVVGDDSRSESCVASRVTGKRTIMMRHEIVAPWAHIEAQKIVSLINASLALAESELSCLSVLVSESKHW